MMLTHVLLTVQTVRKKKKTPKAEADDHMGLYESPWKKLFTLL